MSASTSTTFLPSLAMVRIRFMLIMVLPSEAWQLVIMMRLTLSPEKVRLVLRVLMASVQA